MWPGHGSRTPRRAGRTERQRNTQVRLADHSRRRRTHCGAIFSSAPAFTDREAALATEARDPEQAVMIMGGHPYTVRRPIVVSAGAPREADIDQFVDQSSQLVGRSWQ